MHRTFYRATTWMVFFLALFSLTACGGGGSSSSGNGDNTTGSDITLGITVSGVTTTTTYNQTVSSTGEWGYDPDVYGYVNSSVTFAELYSGYSASSGWDTNLIISYPTTTPGTYTVLNGANVNYTKTGMGGVYASYNTGATITFTRIDPPGGRIQGYFNDVSLYCSNTGSTITMSGNFDVVRDY